MTVRWNAQPTLRRPALVAAFSGWNDAADAASDGVRWLARTVGRACVRDARQRGVPRLPGRPSDGRAGRRRDPRDPVARARVLGRIDARQRPRSRAAARRRAEPALADVLRRRDLGRARDRMRDRRDARRPARRRSPHPPHPVHRLRHRRGALGEARHAAFAVPGPDRHRRCAARRGPPRRVRVGVDLGAGAALRRDRAQPEGDATRCSNGWERCSTSDSSSPISRSPRALGSGRSTRSSPATPTRARTWSGSSSATTRPNGTRRRRRPAPTSVDDDEDWLDEDDLPSGESLAEDFERYLREQRDE